MSAAALAALVLTACNRDTVAERSIQFGAGTNATFRLVSDKSYDPVQLWVSVSGVVHGAASLTLHVPSDPPSRTSGELNISGATNCAYSFDWFNRECDLNYRSRGVTGGYVVVRYRFK